MKIVKSYLGESFNALLVNNIIEFLINYLGLSRSRYNLFLVPLDNDDENDGCVVEGVYNNAQILCVAIKLSNRAAEVGNAICHEMIHVKQITRGLLRYKKNKVSWRGRIFTLKVEYLRRPWELQALREQEILYRTYLDYCTNPKKYSMMRK